jgi:predicted NBD/HSP70 family sugar kinase
VDLRTQRLVFAPNLIWNDLDLKASLERATQLPVELENAANACALAEVWFGRHTRGVRNLVAITVSEGIGAGLILNHQLVQGSSGLAGEFGHATIIEDGLECGCGNRGCWEVYASNVAALRYYAESTKSSRSAVTFDDVLRLAEEQDPKAVAAIQKMGRYLGSGLAMLATGLAPDLIVVIGEVTRVWKYIDPIITETVHSRLPTRAAIRILPSDSMAQPRLVGAIALVLQRHFGAPVVA